MELALFPIAALLLLLSGAGASSSHPPVTATMVHVFLANVAQTTPVTNGRPHAVPSAGFGPSFDFPLAASPDVARLLFVAALLGSNRVHYRTRFGSSTGVYFAVGPPATAPAMIPAGLER